MGKVVKRLTEQELRSTLKACRKYERALIHSNMPRRADGDVRKQFDDYRQAAERNEVMTGQVRQILCQHGIQPCRFVPYYNFALHVAKLKRIESGRGLAALVAHAIGHWIESGHQRAVLEQICRDVYNITANLQPIDGERGPEV